MERPLDRQRHDRPAKRRALPTRRQQRAVDAEISSAGDDDFAVSASSQPFSRVLSPSAGEVIEVVDRIFASFGEGQLGVVTVGDVKLSVASQFCLEKLPRSTKQLVITRLTELIRGGAASSAVASASAASASKTDNDSAAYDEENPSPRKMPPSDEEAKPNHTASASNLRVKEEEYYGTDSSSEQRCHRKGKSIGENAKPDHTTSMSQSFKREYHTDTDDDDEQTPLKEKEYCQENPRPDNAASMIASIKKEYDADTDNDDDEQTSGTSKEDSCRENAETEHRAALLKLIGELNKGSIDAESFEAKYDKLRAEKEFRDRYDAPPPTEGKDYKDPVTRIMARHWVRDNMRSMSFEELMNVNFDIFN